MPTPATTLDPAIATTVSVHANPHLCQWCRKYPATPTGYCCELHQEAHQAGAPHPVWREVPANAIHDGYGGCVWCGQPLASPDCPHPIRIGGTPR